MKKKKKKKSTNRGDNKSLTAWRVHVWFWFLLCLQARKTLAGAPFGAFVVRNSSRGGSFAISVKAKE